MERSTAKDIDEYIAHQPKEVQVILQKIRETIRKAAPGAKESISYQIPTFKMGRNLVHFAAFREHISFFPSSSGVEKFKQELAGYTTSKGTIQFPLGKPIPYGLITKITKFRVKEEMERGRKK